MSMKLSEWIKEDDIAIEYVAVYYGLPRYGHATCYRQIPSSLHPIEHVSRDKKGMDGKCCIACGEPLVPEEEDHA